MIPIILKALTIARNAIPALRTAKEIFFPKKGTDGKPVEQPSMPKSIGGKALILIVELWACIAAAGTIFWIATKTGASIQDILHVIKEIASFGIM